MEEMDKYEFINAFIGWLGTKESIIKLLELDQKEYNALFYDKSEKLDNKIAEKLSILSITELNKFSREFGFDLKISL